MSGVMLEVWRGAFGSAPGAAERAAAWLGPATDAGAAPRPGGWLGGCFSTPLHSSLSAPLGA